MSLFNRTPRLLTAVAVCGALMLPVAAQAKDHKYSQKRNDATKVTDSVTRPGRKVLHAGKKGGKKVLHSAKKDGEAVEHGIGHAVKQVEHH